MERLGYLATLPHVVDDSMNQEESSKQPDGDGDALYEVQNACDARKRLNTCFISS